MRVSRTFLGSNSRPYWNIQALFEFLEERRLEYLKYSTDGQTACQVNHDLHIYIRDLNVSEADF